MTSAAFAAQAWFVVGFDASPLDGAIASMSAAPSPSPSPNLQQGIDPGDVSPGLLGFLPVFAIALVCILLFGSLTQKIRKVNRRQVLLDAEEAAAAASAAGSACTSGSARTADGPDDTAAR